MGKVIDGKYIYSMEDCRRGDCLFFNPKTGGCQVETCCCENEKAEAKRFFPPDATKTIWIVAVKNAKCP